MSVATKAVRLAVSIGCPCGIGPEVSLAGALALRKKDANARVVLVGDLGALRAAARMLDVDPTRLARIREPEEAWTRGAAVAFAGPRAALPVFEPGPPLRAADRRFGDPGRAAGAAQLAWVDAATDLVSEGRADALVTGPVSKDAIARSGATGARGFLGHTEHLAARLSAPEVTMAFYAAFARRRGGLAALTTSLVTTHLPLSAVARAIRPPAVARAVFWTAWFVDRMQDARKRRGRAVGSLPRVAIAALNPHAGEHGLLGHEEARAITPGIALARRRLGDAGIDVDLVGPLPAESAFRIASGGAYDAVVAMYHDQATIPMKLLGFGEAVNVSLGLPIVRTSVDHGTAYDLAGKGAADPRGMREAMLLAARLVRAAPQR